MKILHMMVGLPRSGKSTMARDMGYPIVSPDAIRLALHGTAWRDESEPMVWGVAHMMVNSLFLAGHYDVILDACNGTAKRRKEWESGNYAILFHVVDTPESVCLDRANSEKRVDLIPVIRRMAAVWDPPGMGEDN